jgi:hypothetical protein
MDVAKEIDTVDPELRAQRNEHWRRSVLNVIAPSRANVPLVVFPSLGVAGDNGGPEFPRKKGAIWLIATFFSFHVFAADADYRLIYTEMNFRVENVIKQPSYSTITNGSVVDVDIPGGRIRTPSGTIKELLLSPRRYFFQSDHKYLMLLVYDENAKFFRADERRWDVTSGIVQPDNIVEKRRSKEGTSLIDGMSVPDLLRFLPTVLSDEPESR